VVYVGRSKRDGGRQNWRRTQHWMDPEWEPSSMLAPILKWVQLGIVILAHTYLNNQMKGTVEDQVPGLKVNYAFSICNKATRLNFKVYPLLQWTQVVGHYWPVELVRTLIPFIHWARTTVHALMRVWITWFPGHGTVFLISIDLTQAVQEDGVFYCDCTGSYTAVFQVC